MVATLTGRAHAVCPHRFQATPATRTQFFKTAQVVMHATKPPTTERLLVTAFDRAERTRRHVILFSLRCLVVSARGSVGQI
jgi:hypothetical protein